MCQNHRGFKAWLILITLSTSFTEQHGFGVEHFVHLIVIKMKIILVLKSSSQHIGPTRLWFW